MNPKIIEVELLAPDDNTDVLRFKFESGEMDVNLNSSTCQNELKRIFLILITIVLDTDIELKFTYDEGYQRGMYIEVCEAYIKDLNREMQEVKEQIQLELK